MTWDILYILPIAAILICKVLPVFPPRYRNRRSRMSNDVSRKAFARRVLISRWLVFSLLAGTIVTYFFPVDGANRLAQALIFAVICMIPLILYLVLSFLFRAPINGMRKLESDTFNAAKNSGKSESKKLSSSTTVDNFSNDHALETASQPKPGFSAAPSSGTLADLTTDQREVKVINPDTRKTEDGTLRGQLNQVSQQVKSYDLGKHPRRASLHERSSDFTNADTSKTTPVVTKLDSPVNALADPQAMALKKKVTLLLQDKLKLQRLVIAQKAAFDSEHLSHERSREVAKKAVLVMRDAQEGQRVALKVARRERSERRNLEQKYTKVNRALENALSTLAAQKKSADTVKQTSARHGSQGT